MNRLKAINFLFISQIFLITKRKIRLNIPTKKISSFLYINNSLNLLEKIIWLFDYQLEEKALPFSMLLLFKNGYLVGSVKVVKLQNIAASSTKFVSTFWKFILYAMIGTFLESIFYTWYIPFQEFFVNKI